jgi:hypothetical protein
MPATRADVSWIAANMREHDKREIYCQLSHESPQQLAYELLHVSPRIAYTAQIDGAPAIAYGLVEYRPGYGELWAFGIDRLMYGAIRDVTDHINGELHDMLVADKRLQRIECRSMADHRRAHRWIEQIDLSRVCDLPCWGKNGEDFILFARTRREIDEREKD